MPFMMNAGSDSTRDVGLKNNTYFEGDNAIKLSQAVGRPLLYEAPRIHDRLSRTFIRTRTLVNIKKPLVAGFWVPRPQRKPVWVSIRYERLQNYCYDCGRIGHEAKNCKSQHEGMLDEEAEARWGNSLCTVHVRTREDSVVVHYKDWDEVHLFTEKSIPAAGKATQWKSIGGQSVSGSAKDLGEISAAQSLGRYETKDGQREVNNENCKQACFVDYNGQNVCIQVQHYDTDNCGVTARRNIQGNPQSEITITEIPATNEPINDTPHLMPSSVPIEDPQINGAKSTKKLETVIPEIPTLISPEAPPAIIPSYYTVEYPTQEPGTPTDIIPFTGLSPISEVTTGLHRINLKRHLSLSFEDQDPNPSKKRLMYPELEFLTLPNDTAMQTTDGTQHVRLKNLKKAIRGYCNRREQKGGGILLQRIEELMDREENYRWQRSRILWIQSGTRTQRRRRNNILSIKDENGVWTSNKSIINNLFSNLFTNLFTSSGPRQLTDVVNSVDPKIDNASNELLLRPITREEVRIATFELGGSSPSPDWLLGWDVSPLRHVLDDQAVEAILTIPIPRRLLTTAAVAPFKNGAYSRKSWYYSLTSSPTEITPTARAPSHLTSEIWKATWKVKTSPKVVNFLWRVLSDAIASSCALVKRKRGVSERRPHNLFLLSGKLLPLLPPKTQLLQLQ
ncbi:hypothetical protein K1719_047444 [Acacia pycnantha]|nr:hypothetical protein K1719_047444 [Acacia pycnantha]